MHRLRLKHRRQSSDGYGPRRRGSFAGVVVEDYDVQNAGWRPRPHECGRALWDYNPFCNQTEQSAAAITFAAKQAKEFQHADRQLGQWLLLAKLGQLGSVLAEIEKLQRGIGGDRAAEVIDLPMLPRSRRG
jgi:hypothetical protein